MSTASPTPAGASDRPTETAVGDLLVFYGSLLRGLGLPGEPPKTGLTFVGPCRLAGELYVVNDTRRYPGLRLPEDGAAPEAVVLGEVWRVDDLTTLAAFDAWELKGHRMEATDAPYLRRRVRLLEPDASAWVYQGRHPERGATVPGGDWRAYLRACPPS